MIIKRFKEEYQWTGKHCERRSALRLEDATHAPSSHDHCFSELTLRILLGFLGLDDIIHDSSWRSNGVDWLGIPVQECIFVVDVHLLGSFVGVVVVFAQLSRNGSAHQQGFTLVRHESLKP